MYVVLVLAVLAYWLLGDEPTGQAVTPPATTTPGPGPSAADAAYTIGGTAAPVGNPVQLGGASVERYHRAHRLVPPPPMGPCPGGPK